MTTQTPFRIALVGDGSTAVNALDALLDNLEQAPRPVQIDLYGKADPANIGRGFAYGPIGSRHGNLTEPVPGGHADYRAPKGDFATWRNAHPEWPQPDEQRATRQSIGAFHAERFQQVVEKAERLGIPLNYYQGEVVNLGGAPGQRTVITENGAESAPYDHVTLAVGDVLSQRLRPAAQQFPGQIKQTPYHALDDILANSNENTVVVALGTRSSFTDLANGLKAGGFEGKIIGVSSSGQTSWPTTNNPDTAYQPRYLTPGKSYRTVQNILSDLRIELTTGMKFDGVHYVPNGLMESLYEQNNSIKPERISWDFDPKAERDSAGRKTYHQIVQSIDWEGIYQKLPEKEKPSFTRCLGDFIAYNRVNRIVADDFAELVDHLEHGDVRIQQGQIKADKIRRADGNRLAVEIAPGQNIIADYVVNCAIGPSPAKEQIQHHRLLQNLAKDGVITPQDHGSGFTIARDHREDLSLLGAQARPYCFSGLGIETYGRQITQQWLPDLSQKLDQKFEQAPDQQPAPRYTQTNTPRFRR